jgi:hypothetical protein
MMRTELAIAAVGFLCSTAAAAPLVTFESPCECRDNHGEGRWAVKNGASLPPADASAIQSVTPSDMYGWPGIDAQLTWQSERTGIENKWFALTGRVVAVKVEADGDLHLALQDATGDKPGIVICEIPGKPEWCEIRNTVLVGRELDFLCTFVRQENFRSMKRRSSRSSAKRSGMSATLPKINQTGERGSQITLFGKFTR